VVIHPVAVDRLAAAGDLPLVVQARERRPAVAATVLRLAVRPGLRPAAMVHPALRPAHPPVVGVRPEDLPLAVQVPAHRLVAGARPEDLRPAALRLATGRRVVQSLATIRRARHLEAVCRQAMFRPAALRPAAMALPAALRLVVPDPVVATVLPVAALGVVSGVLPAMDLRLVHRLAERPPAATVLPEAPLPVVQVPVGAALPVAIPAALARRRPRWEAARRGLRWRP
jgi:hypothetical protein